MAGSFLLSLCLAGCAPRVISPGNPAGQPAEQATVGSLDWWGVRFRMHWPEGKEPIWYPDLFIANRVLGPLLDADGTDLPLWRFHRRAAQDAAGRQFSFLFFASPETAQRINQKIAAHPELAKWQRLGIIETVRYDKPGRGLKSDIAATSDPSWSPEMQRAWPYFIMGVSRLWLELIREFGRDPDLPSQPLARYAALGERVDRHWREEGGHALLHHLNAMFGYRELEVVRRKVEVMRF